MCWTVVTIFGSDESPDFFLMRYDSLPNSDEWFGTPCFWPIHSTGLPAYSDSVGTAKKCHCKQNVTVTGIFSKRRSFYGPKKCHCSRNVTVTGVTVSGEACIISKLWGKCPPNLL